MKTGKKKYPFGGLGLRPKEEDVLRGQLEDLGLSLKFVQRYLLRKFMNGEIPIEIKK